MSSSRLEKYLPGNRRVRMLVLMAADISVVCLASFLGLFIRFDLNIEKIPAEYAQAVFTYLPFYVFATILIFFLFYFRFLHFLRINIQRITFDLTAGCLTKFLRTGVIMINTSKFMCHVTSLLTMTYKYNPHTCANQQANKNTYNSK